MTGYQPKTGARCACKRGIQRDNCPVCEGTGWQIDFRAIRMLQRDPVDAANELAYVSELFQQLVADLS